MVSFDVRDSGKAVSICAKWRRRRLLLLGFAIVILVPALSRSEDAGTAAQRGAAGQARVDSLNSPWRTGSPELDLGQGWIGQLAPRRRLALEQSGFNYFGWWMIALQGNVAGGIQRKFRYSGLFDFGIELDFEKIMGARGLLLHTSGSWASGRDLTADVGATIPANAVYSGESLRFFEMWLEQRLLDDKLALRAGRLSVGWEYGLDYDNFTQVLSAAFRLNVFALDINTPNFSVIPFANWGARLRWAPDERWRVQGSFMNGYPRDFADDDKHGLDFSFDPSNGSFFILEGTRQWAASERSRRARPSLLPGRIFTGIYHDTGTFPTLDGSGDTMTGLSTAYFIFKQKFWEPERLSERGANAWTAVAYGWPEEVTTFPYYWSGGIVWYGPVQSHPRDSFAFGFATGWYSSAIPDASYESVVELSYSYNFNTWLSVMPDFQYVIRPGGTGDTDNSVLLGALAYLTF
jgi:porin